MVKVLQVTSEKKENNFFIADEFASASRFIVFLFPLVTMISSIRRNSSTELKAKYRYAKRYENWMSGEWGRSSL